MPASDPITAVADAVTALTDDVAKPLISESQAQAHEDAFTAQCQSIADALAQPEPARQRTLGALASRLCIDNGYPVGGLGDDLSVPMGFLAALLTIAAARIHDTAQAEDLLHALTTK